MTERPEGIIITMPVKFLIDLGRYATRGKHYKPFTKKELLLTGYHQFLMQLETTIKDENICWFHRMNNLPTIEVLYCYVTILGKIMYRANIGGFEPGGERTFGDGRKSYAKNWMMLTHPFIKANPRIKMKGFQGFRYTKMLF